MSYSNLPPGVTHSMLPGWNDEDVVAMFDCPNCGEVELECIADGSLVGKQEVETECECGATVIGTYGVDYDPDPDDPWD